jgi:hypothetical protein
VNFTNYLLSVFFSALVISGCSHRHNSCETNFGDSLYLANIPPQPAAETWKFIEELQTPLWTKHDWQPVLPNGRQADLSEGITVIKNFPDPGGLLETAWEDLDKFMEAGGVKSSEGQYIIEASPAPNLEGEAFRLEITREGCKIFAGDTEGIRRGIFTLEDEMLKAKGPFLPIETIEKKPVIKRRISRCLFGPIKRPPAMRDELMDDVDYYPDNYLNRLAHEGVNGLWLTVEFRDLVSTRFNPEAGKDAEKRFAKLRQTVDKCLRYGIKTYIFTIEPRAWGNRPPYFYDQHVLEKYPEMGGHKGGGAVYFCPFSESSQEYIYQVVNTIFRKVPGLGGMMNISHGERTTTCLSAVYQGDNHEGHINCPVCSKKQPWEILHASLSAMKKGMHDAAPDAELISWLYMSHPINPYPNDTFKLGEWVWDIPSNTPEDVIFQFNFETGVIKEEFGKTMIGGDYFMSTPGPSPRFQRLADSASVSGTKISAKIQTSNSHEVATVPHITVPSLLYRKFEAMHKLGVTHTMLGWYFGNDPGLMTKAAGLLSFEPFPEDENSFLNELASVYWKKEDVPKVVQAWKYFAEGFENYPLSCMFQRYGPMHDGPVWPLLLKPADAPLYPTWQIASSATLQTWPPSGDRIGECMGRILTHEETVELCRRMRDKWAEGMKIFEGLTGNYSGDPDRILDIGVAKALGITFRSGYNILNFYLLREKMFRMDGRERFEFLQQMKDIVKEEISINEELLELCIRDSRIGFHSEAEGYKYYPAKIEWRMNELQKLLKNDFPEIKKQITEGNLLFPEYTGKNPEGLVAYSLHQNSLPENISLKDIPDNLIWNDFTAGEGRNGLRWSAIHDNEDVYFIISDKRIGTTNEGAVTRVTLKLEPRRLWMPEHYTYYPDRLNSDKNYSELEDSDNNYMLIRIPFNQFRWQDEESRPVRVNLSVIKKGAGTSHWKPENPLINRLSVGSDNPEDPGWLVFN